MTFRVGQKVVCVRGPIYGGGYGDEIQPKIGAVYTIRSIEASEGLLWVTLEEIRNSLRDYRGEWCEIVFGSGRFRPVVERKTSIEIFTKMLTPHGVDA